MSRASKKPPRTSRCTPPPAVIHIDGAARGNPGPAGIGIVLKAAPSQKVQEIGRFLGEAPNNVAETMALVVALQEALKQGLKQVKVFTDSELLTRQVLGIYKVKDPELVRLHVLIQNLIEAFSDFKIEHIPRAKNRLADRIAGRAVIDGVRRNTSDSKGKKPKGAPGAVGPGQSTFW